MKRAYTQIIRIYFLIGSGRSPYDYYYCCYHHYNHYHHYYIQTLKWLQSGHY